MEEFDDQKVNLPQLNEELEPLNLPGFTGVARLSRKRDKNGVIQRVPPYILVKCEPLSAARRRAVQQVIDAHTAQPTEHDPGIERQARLLGLIAIPRASWTAAQMREIIQLVAQEHI